jgi:hypothetical protein
MLRGAAYKLMAVLILGDMNGAVGATANLVLDDILIYPVMCPAVGLVTEELDAGIKSFLCVVVESGA